MWYKWHACVTELPRSLLDFVPRTQILWLKCVHMGHITNERLFAVLFTTCQECNSSLGNLTYNFSSFHGNGFFAYFLATELLSVIRKACLFSCDLVNLWHKSSRSIVPWPGSLFLHIKMGTSTSICHSFLAVWKWSVLAPTNLLRAFERNANSFTGNAGVLQLNTLVCTSSATVSLKATPEVFLKQRAAFDGYWPVGKNAGCQTTTDTTPGLHGSSLLSKLAAVITFHFFLALFWPYCSFTVRFWILNSQRTLASAGFAYEESPRNALGTTILLLNFGTVSEASGKEGLTANDGVIRYCVWLPFVWRGNHLPSLMQLEVGRNLVE